jgi:TonB family protein
MQRPSPFRAKHPLAAILVAAALVAPPSAGFAQGAPPAKQNQAWTAKMTSLLKLAPAQEAALKSFMEISATSADVNAPSAAQVRAMSLVEQFDSWAAQTVTIQSHAQADALALHRFYASLSPAQRERFDAATRHDVTPNVAADVIPAPGLEEPDYKLPAHKDADWLVKPTAENIARVYPSAAMKAHITGKVILGCIVDEDGYLADCVVKSETPQGQGFGNAALEITAYMRMQPAMNYGVPAKGGVNLPIAFTLPEPD